MKACLLEWTKNFVQPSMIQSYIVFARYLNHSADLGHDHDPSLGSFMLLAASLSS